MAEEFKGLSQEQLNKLDQFKQATAEVYESYKAINKELNDAEQVQDKLTKRQFQGRDVVDRIAQLQKEAVTSTDAARKLEVEKAKQLVLEVLKNDENVMQDDAHAPKVVVHNLGENGIELLALPYATCENYWKVYWETKQQIVQTLGSNGFKPPLPQRVVTMTNKD